MSTPIQPALAPATAPNGNGLPPVTVLRASRQRTIQSCSECKRRKIKCDRTFPCGQCKLRSEEMLCREVMPELQSTLQFPSLREFATLTERVASLEGLIKGMQMTMQLMISQNPGVEPPLLPKEEPLSRDETESDSPADETMAMMLEDLAMGHKLNRDRAIDTDQPNTEVNSPHMSTALRALPDPKTSVALVKFYFQKVEWYTRSLHQPSYLLTFKEFLAGEKAPTPEWLCVHMSVLCLAYYYWEMDPCLSLTTAEAQLHAKNLFEASRTLLFASDFLTNHKIEFLQCIILQGVYQYNIDSQADNHWALTGAAIKIAQNIGLSRLGGEQPVAITPYAAGAAATGVLHGQDHRIWPAAWQNPLKREIGRRVWWNLVYLDWSHALAHGTTYCIQPGQNYTLFPCNVNDSDMVDNEPIPAVPFDVYTESSFLIYWLRFLTMYREIVDHLNTHSPPDYAFILDMDARLISVIGDLPEYFRSLNSAQSTSASPTIIGECILIHMTGENRLLRLHRPYLSMGYRHGKYHLSTQRCIKSAHNIISLFDTAAKRAPFMLSNWLILFYAFAASVVIFVDLCHLQTEFDQKRSREILFRAINLFKRVQLQSAAARNSVALLEGLLQAEAEVSKARGVDRKPVATGGDSPDKKRPIESPEETPFHRAVKKLVVGANRPSHTVSPPTQTHSTANITNELNGTWALEPTEPSSNQADIDIFIDSLLMAPGAHAGAPPDISALDQLFAFKQ